MEIERKYLVAKLPDQLETYPMPPFSSRGTREHRILLYVSVRDNEKYELTYKSAGLTVPYRNITFS